MIAIIPAFAALLSLIALIGILLVCVLPPEDKRKAVINCALAFLIFSIATAHLYQRTLHEPLPTPNTNFNQLP